MKKILLMAVSAVLLAAGCQKTEIVNPVGEPTMNFSAKMGKLTKAGTTPSDGEAKLQEQEFKVWAFTTWTDEINGIIPGMVHKGMSALDVHYNAEKNTWYTEAEYYWPGTGLDLNFFALSSRVDSLAVDFNKTVDGETVATEGSDTTDRVMNVKAYKVNYEDPVDDLMVADFVHQNQNGNKNVTLKFRHALSKVEFLFKTTQDPDSDEYRDVQIDSVKVNGIKTVGNLTVTETVSAEEAAPSYLCAWNELSTEQTFLAEQADFVIDAAADEPATFATWLVLPQDIAMSDDNDLNKDLTVEIFYQMGENSDDTSFKISTSTLKAWEPNQYIRYIVDITPALIKFTPEVEDWVLADDVNANN